MSKIPAQFEGGMYDDFSITRNGVLLPINVLKFSNVAVKLAAMKNCVAVKSP